MYGFADNDLIEQHSNDVLQNGEVLETVGRVQDLFHSAGTQKTFFNTLEKTPGEKKSALFSLRPITQDQFCQKPQASGIFKHMAFFSKKTYAFQSDKACFMVLFN